MEDPKFTMPGVIKSKDDMEDFEGPLTLLLYLLSKNKVEIQDIRISEILEQYLQYLENMKSMDLDIASEFVQMASHLVYIKTKTLLSEDEEIPELELLKMSMEELRNRDIYKQIKGICETMSDMSHIGSGYIEKPQEYLPGKAEYRYVHHVSDLLSALADVFGPEVSRSAAEEREFVIPTPIVYSVSEKADEILQKLRDEGDISVYGLIMRSKSRSEIVATLIAVLELCKMGSIRCNGGAEDGEEGENYTVSFIGAPVSAVTAE